MESLWNLIYKDDNQIDDDIAEVEEVGTNYNTSNNDQEINQEFRNIGYMSAIPLLGAQEGWRVLKRKLIVPQEYRNAPEIITTDRHENQANFSAQDYVAGLTSFTQFPQYTRERGAYNRSVLRSIWDTAFFSEDIHTASEVRF